MIRLRSVSGPSVAGLNTSGGLSIGAAQHAACRVSTTGPLRDDRMCWRGCNHVGRQGHARRDLRRPQGAGGGADRGRPDARASAPSWSATTPARRPTCAASTPTAPRSASTRSAATCPPTSARPTLDETIDELNANPECTGYIVQLPLPKHLDENAALERVDPDKDADGLHPTNLGRLVLNEGRRRCPARRAASCTCCGATTWRSPGRTSW